MKTKFTLSFFLLVIIGVTAFTHPVNEKQARIVATNFYYEVLNQYRYAIEYDNIVIRDVFTAYEYGQTMYYAFDLNPEGFVIVSAEDGMKPVIGYSFEGEFPRYTDSKSNYGSFIKSYCDEIRYIRQNNLTGDEYISQLWDHLLTNDIGNLSTEKGGRDVEPLLFNLWNQDDPYNIMCPFDPAGPGGHVYAGCVATAMSMIMQYWGYPDHGEGSHSYNASGYGTQTADFENTWYDWSGMQHEAQNVYPWAIAEIQYHCAVAVDMGFGPNGSGANSSIVDDRLRQYFRYENVTYLEKQDYSNTQWMAHLSADIDAGKPIFYRGTNTDNLGHAFVCDGYQGTYFHFNFGWSGSGNGYYSLYNVNGFHRWQACVKNFYPTEASYPYFAEGNYEINTLAGSITDGSGPVEDYLNNQNATWLINPQSEEDSVTNIDMTFYKFDLEASDVVVVYDGNNTGAPVLGSYSGANPPVIGYFLTSSGNQVLVTFQTNGSGTAPGFLLEFTSDIPEFCSGLVTFTEPTASFNDGSNSFYYNNGAACMWRIQPEFASNITLYFDEFDTEEGFDVLKVYDGSSLLGSYSGDQIPDPVTASSGSMFITFNTNAWVNNPGFEAYYTIDNVSVKENGGFEVLSIYPNPTSDNIYVKFRSSDDKQYSLRLMSITGKLVYEQDYTEMNDWTNAVIDVSNLSDGIYMLNIQTDTKSVTKRIIVE